MDGTSQAKVGRISRSSATLKATGEPALSLPKGGCVHTGLEGGEHAVKAVYARASRLILLSYEATIPCG
jgi:hypothetical protein